MLPVSEAYRAYAHNLSLASCVRGTYLCVTVINKFDESSSRTLIQENFYTRILESRLSESQIFTRDRLAKTFYPTSFIHFHNFLRISNHKNDNRRKIFNPMEIVT